MGKKKEPKLRPEHSHKNHGHKPSPSKEDEKPGQNFVGEQTQKSYENRDQNAQRLVKIKSYVGRDNNSPRIDIKDFYVKNSHQNPDYKSLKGHMVSQSSPNISPVYDQRRPYSPFPLPPSLFSP